MILRLEMILSVMSYEKTLFLMKKIWILQKIILLLMIFVIEFFLTIASYQFLKNY